MNDMCEFDVVESGIETKAPPELVSRSMCLALSVANSELRNTGDGHEACAATESRIAHVWEARSRTR